MELARAPEPAIAVHARTLLTQSLALWQVGGTVGAGTPPAIAEIRAQDGTVLRVEPAAADELPIRWWVRWSPPAGSPPAAERSRPCTSVVGLLRTVRTALGAERGQRLRIAPAPSNA
jgi:hypothetical protein